MWCLFFTIFTAGPVFSNVQTIGLESLEVYGRPKIVDAPDGQLCLYSSRDKLVMFLDPAGNPQNIISGQGQGPGQFQWVTNMTWSEQESAFLIFDKDNKRVSRWSAKGEHLQDYRATWRTWYLQLIGPAQAYYLVDSGLAGSQPTLMFSENATDNGSHEIWRSKPLEKHTGAVIKLGDAQMIFNNDWDARVKFSAAGKTAAVFDGVGKEVLVFSKNQLVTKISPKFKRQMLDPESYEEMLAGLKTRLRNAVKKQYKPPENYPLISYLHVDNDARIWVGTPNYHKKAKPFQFEVYNTAGKRLGEGSQEIEPLHIGFNRIYTLETKEEDLLFLNISSLSFE